MTIDPQVLRSEAHGEVGRVIEADADALIERWARRAVDEQPNAARVHHEALRDHLPDFLRTLGRELAQSTDPDDVPHWQPAEQHGEQRWDAGWSLSEVVRDYQILRLVLFDHLQDALGRPLRPREVQAIGLALDESITASVDAYVRQREESLRVQAAALREADRRKNEFLAVLAHELRNPLAPILNSVEVLRRLGPADGNVAQARDIVERQVRQMVRLVDDLLDVTRIAQGKVELRRTTFELQAAAAEAVQTTAPLYESLGHRLSVSVPDEPVRLEADPARVVQVLVNLLNNAAKYTEPGGQVTLAGAREGDEVVARVRDTGVGIEPEMLGRVFDLFTQVGGSLGRSQGGLGIGLTLVRQLVEMHGGSVEAHSEGPGRGSEFVVRLPAAGVPRAEVPAPTAPEGPPATGRHILIVEDNADQRSTLETLLRILGHRVESAGTGPEAVERALASRPEVVLIDLGLPGMDGYEVARQLRAGHPGAQLIALTGHAQEEDRRRTSEAGFVAHLVKPVELEDLTRLLDRVPPAPPA
jgi:signal transduction histidine kinase